MTNFLKFAEQKLQERDFIPPQEVYQEVYGWSEEKFSEEELAKKTEAADISKIRLDLSEVTKILQGDLDRQIISPDSVLKEYYDFYKERDDDKILYQQQYVGVGKDAKQDELRAKAREFFEKIKEKHPANVDAINLLEEDLTKKIGANVDKEVAMAVPYLMLQTITYFDQIDKIQDNEKKQHFLSQFPMNTTEEYACVGGFSTRLNPILMTLNAENVHLTSAHQSAVSSSSLNIGDGVHQQAMMNALFGINLKDEGYLVPFGMFSAQELWQGYLDYHGKLQEQFLLQQEQVKKDVIDLAKLFDEGKDALTFSKELKEKFSLKDTDFYKYDEDLMPIIDDEKVEKELKKRAENYYPKGIDLPSVLQNTDLIKNFHSSKTVKVIGNILYNPDSSQSEKNVALNYLWIGAVKEVNDVNKDAILSKVKEEELLLFLMRPKNYDDRQIKSFFNTQEQQSPTVLEQIASFDDPLSQNKLILIKDKLKTTSNEVSNIEDLLFYAAKNDYPKVIEKILNDKNSYVYIKKQNGLTLLMVAASKGHLKVVDKLLEHRNIDVNRSDKNGATALMFSAAEGHSEVVEKLLGSINLLGNRNIDVNRSDKNGATALMFAAAEGHSEVVDKLLAHPKIKASQHDNYGATALMFAAKNGHVEVVDKIVQKLCIDGTDPKDIACLEEDRQGIKIFNDADKISSFANQISLLIKPKLNFSEAGQKKLEPLVRKSLFKEIFTNENKENIDFITTHFTQEGVAESVANAMTEILQSSGAIRPSRSRLALVPFNNLKTLNTEHEGIEGLFSDSVKELINQALTPSLRNSISNQNATKLCSQRREK